MYFSSPKSPKVSTIPRPEQAFVGGKISYLFVRDILVHLGVQPTTDKIYDLQEILQSVKSYRY